MQTNDEHVVIVGIAAWICVALALVVADLSTDFTTSRPLQVCAAAVFIGLAGLRHVRRRSTTLRD